MSSRTQEQEQATRKPSVAAPNLSRRSCACGGAAGLGGSCGSCQAKELALPQRNGGPSGHAFSTPGVDGGLHAFAEARSHAGLTAYAGNRPGHGFGRTHVRPPTSDAQSSQRAPFAARSAGRMSMRVARGAATARSNATEISDESPNEQTASSSSTSGNRIDITFDPTTSSPRPQCDQIIQTQWIQMLVDGTPIMPGTYYTPWTCRDATCLPNATYLDHGSCTYTTPYPVDRGIGTSGSSNGTVTNATYYDAPRTSGGNRGFRSAANPTGWQTVTYLFGNYAFCAAGTDCGTWYDGIAWNYTKTAADAAAGLDGVATDTASLAPPGPNSTIVAAFDQYNRAKSFTPCLYSRSP